MAVVKFEWHVCMHATTNAFTNVQFALYALTAGDRGIGACKVSRSQLEGYGRRRTCFCPNGLFRTSRTRAAKTAQD
eukprot:5689496-Pleurochrysis_carterae.AAC.1